MISWIYALYLIEVLEIVDKLQRAFYWSEMVYGFELVITVADSLGQYRVRV